MRILLISNLYPPHVLGGAEILARDYAVQLKELGHEVKVLTSWYGLDGPQQDAHTWRTLHYSHSAHVDKRRSLWQQRQLLLDYYRNFHNAPNAREVRRAIAELGPDAVYVWEIDGLGLISVLKSLNALATPLVYHLGSYWLQYALSPQTEQTRLRTRQVKKLLIGSVPFPRCTSLIAVSGAVKDAYMKIGCDPQRIEVIHNGIDDRFLSMPRVVDAQHERRAEKTRLIYVGRLCEEKGVLVLLKALEALVHQREEARFTLDIFGEGDLGYVKELYDFVRSRNLDTEVAFHGKVPQEELIRWYDEADVMLVPSLWKEPFGLVVAEAMARSLPVIATNTGGPTEIVTHAVDGLLVEPNNEQALAAAVLRLVDDQALARRLGHAARLTVEERFTVKANARKVEQHLQRAIAFAMEEIA